jgi:signal transduction histidine kinase
MTLFRKKTEHPEKIDSLEDSESGPNKTDLLKGQLSALKDFILIGKLTPEIVHDINNYLTGILGYAELLSMKPIQDQSLKKGLQNITLSAEKCRELLSHLTGLLRSERLMPAQGNMNESVEKIILLRHCALRHKQISIQKSLGINLPGIPVPGPKLERALLALIFYAEEVLEKKAKDRKINIKTSAQASNQLIIRLEVFASEEAYHALLRDMERDTSAPMDISPLGVGLKEAMDWIDGMGGLLKVEKMAEGGFSFLVHFPQKT